MRTFQALLLALLFPDTYVGHTGSIPRSFLKCLSPTNDTGRAQPLPRPRAGVPTAGFSSSQDPGWQLGKEAEVPHTPRTDVLQHAKPPYVLAQLAAFLRDSGLHLFIPLPPPKPHGSGTRRMQPTAGEKNPLSRNQHACCFRIKPAPAVLESVLQSAPFQHTQPGTRAGTRPPAQRCGDPSLCSAPRPPLSNSHRGKTKAERYLRHGALGKHRREPALGSAR